jgi:hypothetical protein
LNYLGPEYIEAHGVDYFKKAPFLRVDKIGGGLKCSTRNLPFEAIDARRERALVEYFGGPDQCRIYRSGEHRLQF